jgi:FkbM family methyltransferase
VASVVSAAQNQILAVFYTVELPMGRPNGEMPNAGGDSYRRAHRSFWTFMALAGCIVVGVVVYALSAPVSSPALGQVLGRLSTAQTVATQLAQGFEFGVPEFEALLDRESRAALQSNIGNEKTDGVQVRVVLGRINLTSTAFQCLHGQADVGADAIVEWTEDPTAEVWASTPLVLLSASGELAKIKPSQRVLGGLKPKTRYWLRCQSLGETSEPTTFRTVLIGALSIGRNEDAVAPYVVGSLVQATDHYVYVDNHDRNETADHTIALLTSLFADEISAGRLTVVDLRQYSKSTFDSATARNVGIDILRNIDGMDGVVSLDADDLIQDDICAATIVRAAKQRPPMVRLTWDMAFANRNWSHRARTSLDFHQTLVHDVSEPGLFWYDTRTGFSVQNAVQPLAGLYATGRWVDEAEHKASAEGYHWTEGVGPFVHLDAAMTRRRTGVGTGGAAVAPCCTVSYSNSRPEDAMIRKALAWSRGTALETWQRFLAFKTFNVFPPANVTPDNVFEYARARSERIGRTVVAHPESMRRYARRIVDLLSPEATTSAHGRPGLLTSSLRVLSADVEQKRACPAYVPTFEFKYADTRVQMHINAQQIVKYIQSVEQGFCERFAKIVASCASADDSDSSVILDIGANQGLYGIWAASVGCRVILFEPQPDCHGSILGSVCSNGPYRHPPLLVTQPVMSKAADPRQTIAVYHGSGCAGTYGAYNTLKKADAAEGHQLLQGANVMALVGNAHVRFMKIDVEGGELRVIEHVLPLFRSGQIGEAIIEFTTTFWEQRGVSREAAWNIIRKIYDSG